MVWLIFIYYQGKLNRALWCFNQYFQLWFMTWILIMRDCLESIGIWEATGFEITLPHYLTPSDLVLWAWWRQNWDCFIRFELMTWDERITWGSSYVWQYRIWISYWVDFWESGTRIDGRAISEFLGCFSLFYLLPPFFYSKDTSAFQFFDFWLHAALCFLKIRHHSKTRIV